MPFWTEDGVMHIISLRCVCERHAHKVHSHLLTREGQEVEWTYVYHLVYLSDFLSFQTRSDAYFLTSQHHAPSWSVSKNSMVSCTSSHCIKMHLWASCTHIFWQEKVKKWSERMCIIWFQLIWLFELSNSKWRLLSYFTTPCSILICK